MGQAPERPWGPSQLGPHLRAVRGTEGSCGAGQVTFSTESLEHRELNGRERQLTSTFQSNTIPGQNT